MIPQEYSDRIGLVSSEKVLLVWVEPSQRAITWVLHSGSVYKRVCEYVIGVKVSTTALIEVFTTSLNASEWFFDAESKTCYVRMSDGSNPNTKYVVLTYRYFFSDAPYVLTHDLTETGNEVEYEALVTNNLSFPKEIDAATQLGIALESNGHLDLENHHGFFDSIFDTLFWENKRVVVYSWFPEIAFSKARKMFEGFIQDKSFTEKLISFNIIDQIYALRKDVPLPLFSLSDGTIPESVIGTPKRRLYGRVTGLQTQSVDQVLGGYPLTGTLSVDLDGTTVTGIGTLFLSECSPNDEIKVVVDTETVVLHIDKIQSNTQFTLASGSDYKLTAVSAINLPSVPYRNYNRTHMLAGHKLRQPSTTILEVIQVNRLKVGSTLDMFPDDLIQINGVSRFIKRIVDDVIVLTQSLPNPVVGQTVIKNPVTLVHFNKRSLFIDRDFTITNTTESFIEFNNLAEFNQARVINLIGTIDFTNTSRTVAGTNTKFLTELKSRDWIKSDNINHQVYYEVLQINSDTELEVRIAYAGATTSGTAQYKAPVYMSDNSVVLVDCMGMEKSGAWIKTASDVVKDLVVEAGLTNIDTTAFANAVIEAPFIVSLKLPLSPKSDLPIVRNVINLVNQSVFGSLISKHDFSIAYNIINSEKPTDLLTLNDDDLLDSPTVKTKTTIYKNVKGNYNHFDADIYSLEEGSSLVEFQSVFVENLIGNDDTLNIEIYLNEASDAETITQRYALFYSLTQAVVKVRTKLQLSLKNIGDKILLDLDRLFYRFGGSGSRQKTGVITKITKSSVETNVEFTDLGNIFNRVACIADNSALNFALAEESDKIKNSYIVDATTELPDSSALTDEEWNTNLIG